MTEKEWLTGRELQPLLQALRGKATDRKLRLFACGCAQWLRDLPSSDYGPWALETAERWADGGGSKRELLALVAAGRNNWNNPGHSGWLAVGTSLALDQADEAAFYTATYSVEARCPPAMPNRRAAKAAERRVYLGYLRDIFGNPFRPVTLDPAWLRWNGGTVRQMAERIYDDRAFENLPILADALEEAGCFDAAILDHCRQGGNHVRACWVIDLLLGKK